MNCNFCNTIFNSTYQIAYHILIKHPFERHISCPICKRNFKNATALGGHLRYNHPVIKLKRQNAPDNMKANCPVCSVQIDDKDKMLPHVKEHAIDGGTFLKTFRTA